MLDNLNDVSVQNVSNDFIEMRKQALHQDLSSAFMSGDEHQIQNKLKEYDDFTLHVSLQEEEDVLTGLDVEDVMSLYDQDSLIRVLPKSLNSRLGGGIPRPSHILVVGRVESGKSLTVINMAAGFINDGHRVLFVENEDNPKATMSRFICRLSGMKLQEVQKDPETAQEIANSRGYSNLLLAPMSPGSLKDIERLIEKYEPDCVIVNQMHNLSLHNENRVEKLGLLAEGLRNLSNKYGVVMVSVTQAGGEAHGKLILEMDDVFFSSTGVQAMVDVMIGIGNDATTDEQGFRFLSLPKNKVTGDHGSLKVRVIPSKSMMVSD